MQLPAKSAANVQRYNYARYLARRARRSKLPDLEAEVKGVTATLRLAAAAEQEAEELVQDALADRDAGDDELDDLAKRHRQTIEGRGTNANRERPYTDIYPDGIAWYTAAPLAEQRARYELLARRYADHLPEGDPVRSDGTQILDALAGWSAAADALAKAELEVAVARAKTARAVADWETTLNRIYFRLAERLGRAAAERFFPRVRRGTKSARGGAEPDPNP